VLTRRIIPCLDVKDGRVVKGVRFRDHVDMGDIVQLATRYRDEGADELVFYDISASPQGRSVDAGWVRRVAEVLDIPFCVAGGIRSVADARTVLHAGADKVSVNTPAIERPELLTELADAFGVQCVVAGVDSLRDGDGQWRVRSHTGDPDRMRAHARPTLDWVQEVQQRGAGEVVLNCMGSDGVRDGYDIEQLRAVRAACGVPLVASGGAGTPAHFAAVFRQADVDGALAASVFHSGAIRIPALKRFLAQEGIDMRPAGANPQAAAATPASFAGQVAR
jgi:cyclase